MCEMASKSRVNDYLLLVFGFRELDQEDFRGEVVDVRDSQSHKRIRQLVGYDLASVSCQLDIYREEYAHLNI